MRTKKAVEWLWDSWCILSLIGIWPRYIEPHLLSISKIQLPILHLPPALEGLTILQISDLHWHAHFSKSFRQKLISKIQSLDPDIIVFTGDFLVKSHLECPNELLRFLWAIKAKRGCFAVLGNHDYANYVTINTKGDYDIEQNTTAAPVSKGFKRLIHPTSLTAKVCVAAQETPLHKDLVDLLNQSPFHLLHNSTERLSIKGEQINICGVGEHTLGKCLPEQAYKNYDTHFPGVVLTHNPDAIPNLLKYPGDLILAGHTHGGQVNLPVIWKKFTRIEQVHLKRGLKKIDEKWIYINRGIGSIMHFRWFSTPELTLFTLRKKLQTVVVSK